MPSHCSFRHGNTFASSRERHCTNIGHSQVPKMGAWIPLLGSASIYYLLTAWHKYLILRFREIWNVSCWMCSPSSGPAVHAHSGSASRYPPSEPNSVRYPDLLLRVQHVVLSR